MQWSFPPLYFMNVSFFSWAVSFLFSQLGKGCLLLEHAQYCSKYSLPWCCDCATRNTWNNLCISKINFKEWFSFITTCNQPFIIDFFFSPITWRSFTFPLCLYFLSTVTMNLVWSIGIWPWNQEDVGWLSDPRQYQLTFQRSGHLLSCRKGAHLHCLSCTNGIIGPVLIIISEFQE